LKSRHDHQKKESLSSRQIFAISEYELSNDTLKFFKVEGLLKKKRLQIKEIPIYEITKIDSYGNELNVTWNGVTSLFSSKNRIKSFSELQQKILVMQEEHQKNLELNEKTNLRKTDLNSIIPASMETIDLSFNILMGLNLKRINWKPLQGYSDNLKENLNLQLQTMNPLMLNFSKIASAIIKQDPKKTSKEVYTILKSIYEYYESLKTDLDLKEIHPNLQDYKNVIIAYYILNDLLLGKVVEDKENKKELHQLESILQLLANNTNFKVDIDALKAILNMAIPENDLESFVEDTRAIFRQQLIQL
jgi:hypothetical protein